MMWKCNKHGFELWFDEPSLFAYHVNALQFVRPYKICTRNKVCMGIFNLLIMQLWLVPIPKKKKKKKMQLLLVPIPVAC